MQRCGSDPAAELDLLSECKDPPKESSSSPLQRVSTQTQLSWGQLLGEFPPPFTQSKCLVAWSQPLSCTPGCFLWVAAPLTNLFS